MEKEKKEKEKIKESASKYDHTKNDIAEAVGISKERFEELGLYIASTLEEYHREYKGDPAGISNTSRLIEFLELDTETTMPEKLFAMFKMGRYYEQIRLSQSIAEAVMIDLLSGLSKGVGVTGVISPDPWNLKSDKDKRGYA